MCSMRLKEGANDESENEERCEVGEGPRMSAMGGKAAVMETAER